ncbi:MAG: cytochrome b5 domain-containing protein [Candidatus Falkowbacteria bacterium]
MKKLTTISLFIFWAVVVAVFASGLVYYQNSKTQNKINASISGYQATVETTSSSTLAALRNNVTQLSATEIAKHNSAGDCWLLINNKVYNVTSFIAAHPGGAGTIIPNCGKESTQAYNTKGSNNSHSANANSMLVDYYIGYLDQIFSDAKNIPSASATQTSQNNLAASSPSTPTTNQAAASVTTPPAPVIAASVTLNMTEIVKHNSSRDCWLLINNKVYNVTSFIAAHPGGSGTIIPNCGKDSTWAYNTKGGNSPHSANANAMLVDYFIGNFNQQIGQQQIQQNVQTTNTVTPPQTRGGEFEDD